ncbi:MAG: FG-GAP repeat protein, partial [Proteobacteria bacterium]|nr:FG-GAP repeat protein [Pseudomonadota bacterium]
RSYVVFGGSGVGSSGLVAFSGLNGSNGFKLSGEVTSDCSGYSVSVVGDINDDGFVDLLIGAPLHASSTGRSYVVFGGSGVGSSSLITTKHYITATRISRITISSNQQVSDPITIDIVCGAH